MKIIPDRLLPTRRAPRLLDAQKFDDAGDFGAQRQGDWRQLLLDFARGVLYGRFFQAVAGAADGEALLVEQLADTPHQQDFVVLVVAAVAAPLDRA